ncbi:hypothetical protein [uncultured Methanobrevibacter sp.]|uniref:hypothetical protein n=1 Tax=uncultured Methanobrevibacter sp. TaxID=253161 RepID=UPI00261F8F3F|nr:hypothetical protein [uncultured Methanobrevibacter sp.]
MLKEDIIDREFFVIDCESLHDVKDRLYGFSIKDNAVVQDSDISEYECMDDIGAYVLVKRNNNEIIISQDFIGSYGIYLYEKDDYFAISNSFIKLVDYLKTNHPMTLNEDYASISLIPKTLSSLIHEKTLVNEITCIPRNFKLHIDIKSKEISYEKTVYDDFSVPLNSEEGLKLLDKWFYKWVEIIRAIKQKTNNMSLDLSGGFDTRMIMALVLNANIDINSINVYSIDNNQHNHNEDFRIASSISDEYGFTLNSGLDVEYYNFADIQTILDLSCYVKLGFSNQLNFKMSRSQEPVYMITGMGGETIRGWPLGDSKSQITNVINKTKRLSPALVDASVRAIEESHDAVRQLKPSIRDETFQWDYYKETRLRNHFGKLIVENYMANSLALCPLIDPDLFKLKISTPECSDDSLLMTLIFVRYCPELMEFDVEGGREFNPETIEHAKLINEIHPFEAKEYEFLSKVDADKGEELIENNEKVNWHDINNYIKDIFKSSSFRHEFEKYVPPLVYDRINYSVDHRDYFPLQNTFPAFAIVKVIDAINHSKHDDDELISDWFDGFSDADYEDKTKMNPEFPLLLSKFITSRIDIKNTSSKGNSIEIIENSDATAKVDFPQWLQNENGGGCIIESMAGYLDVKVRCIGDGDLSIKLRGINALDRNKNRYPVYIDYTDFEVNGNQIINDNTLSWHDKPIYHEMPVKDGDVIAIHLEWMPINDNSLSENYNLIIKENEQLKREVENLRKINQEMQSSTSWKVTSPLRKIKNR